MSDEKKPYIINGERVTLEEYRKTKYEDLRIRVPIGKKEKIKEFANSTGESLNSFVNNAIDEKMEREKNWILALYGTHNYIQFMGTIFSNFYVLIYGYPYYIIILLPNNKAPW